MTTEPERTNNLVNGLLREYVLTQGFSTQQLAHALTREWMFTVKVARFIQTLPKELRPDWTEALFYNAREITDMVKRLRNGEKLGHLDIVAVEYPEQP